MHGSSTNSSRTIPSKLNQMTEEGKLWWMEYNAMERNEDSTAEQRKAD